MLLDAPCATPPGIIDVRPIGPRGAPGQPGGSTWPSRAAAAADAIPAELTAIRVQGYYFVGDGGAADYKRIAAPGTPRAYQFQDAAGAWWELAEKRPNVAQFGALASGAIETAALQAGVDFARDTGAKRLRFHSGTYVSATLTVYSGSALKGNGPLETRIRLANGTNADLILGQGTRELAGSTGNGGLDGLSLVDLTLDGNRSNNTAGRCLAVFGQKLFFENLFVCNAPQDGIHTEWGQGGESDFGMEGKFRDIRIDRCGGHGWRFAGPHDSTFTDIKIIDASLNGAGAANNLHITGNANGQFYGVHTWQRNASPRSNAGLLLSGFGGCEFVGCHFEGSNTPVVVLSAGNAFAATRAYASAGGATLFFGGAATGNRFSGYLGQKHPGSPDPIGIVFGSGANDYVADNVIEVTTHLQDGGQVNYGNKSGGNNRIIINGYASAGFDWGGQPHINDTPLRDIRISGPLQSVYNTSFPPRIAASVTFDATTGAIISRANVSAITKIAAGQWRLFFGEKVPTGAKVVGSCAAGSDHINVVVAPFGNSDESQDILIRRTDTEGPSDSPPFVSVVLVAPTA